MHNRAKLWDFGHIYTAASASKIQSDFCTRGMALEPIQPGRIEIMPTSSAGRRRLLKPAIALLILVSCRQATTLNDNVTTIGRAEVSGDVLDSAGTPQQGLTVYARVLEQGAVESQARITDARGQFKFSVFRNLQRQVPFHFPDTVSATVVAEFGGRTVASVATRIVLDTVTRDAPVLNLRLRRSQQ
jgi:hypothetical protein